MNATLFKDQIALGNLRKLLIHPSRRAELEGLCAKDDVLRDQMPLFQSNLSFGIPIAVDSTVPLTTTVRVRKLRLPSFSRRRRWPLVPPRKWSKREVDVLGWWVTSPSTLPIAVLIPK